MGSPPVEKFGPDLNFLDSKLSIKLVLIDGFVRSVVKCRPSQMSHSGL